MSLQLVNPTPANDEADPIRTMALRLGRFDAVWPRIVAYSIQARNGATELERQLAGSMLAELVRIADEMLRETP